MTTRTVLDIIGGTPLLQLCNIVPADAKAAVWVKCEHLNPGGSIKDRIAKAIVEDAEARGLLSPGATLIEATAGNTGVGLALVAAVRGYRLICVMPEKMSEDKRVALRALGAEVIITDNAPPDDPRNFQQVARRLAEERGAFLTDQFVNTANPLVHERTTGPELLAQAGGTIGAFVAGAGTGGTITGVARFLRWACPSARVVLADPVGSGLAGRIRDGVPGPDGAYTIEGIGSSAVPEVLDLSLIDEAISVSDTEAYDMADRLVREEGLLVGGSAGAAVFAALQVACRGGLEGPVVALLPDSWDRYQATHFSPAWRQEKGV
jgi:cysteine synthase